MFKKGLFISLFILLIFSVNLTFANQEARVLRTPTIHGDQIVFTYAGDLYAVSSEGGVARKLTSHEGFEIFPRYSYDGKYIAFTGEYDGSREVFMIPREGGVPKRLTYTAALGRDDVSDRMGPNNIVMGWKHDNSSIVFRSRMREWNSFNGQLYLTTVKGDYPVQIPLPRGGFCSFSPDDKKLAYNRIFREFRTWKRYRGGMADDIWVYDFASKKVTNITDNPAQDIIPMWKDQSIYFLSDRDENKKMNLFVYDTQTKNTLKLTDFKDYDIKFPSLGDKAIVFENGGFIYKFDLAKTELIKVPIRIANDMNSGRTKLVKAGSLVSNYEISPDGKRALFGARGDVFTVPAEYGNTRNLTGTPGVHERNSKWSPDGRWIAYISDASGENEIYLTAQDGTGNPVQITSEGDTYKYQMLWSPDSKKLLWGDKKLRLNYIDIKSKKTVVVHKAEAWEITDYSWSPDSKWVAFSRQEKDTMQKIYLYSLITKKSQAVTDGWYSSYSPVFHSEGKYLFFVSNRDFNPIYSSTEWNHAYGSMARIYFVTLNKEVESPFKPKSDEVAVKKETEEKTDPKKDKKADTKTKDADKKKVSEKALHIEIAGIKDRILRLPVGVARYRNLASVKDALYYIKMGDKDLKPSFKMYDLKAQKETDLGSVGGYEISFDQKKMLVSQNKSYAIINLPKAPVKLSKKLDLSQMEARVDLKKEWNQIFVESWRQMKYFFYAPNMHGVDWDLMKKRYQPLARAVNHRADLTYVIGEMISELSVGHTYVGGGDMPRVKRIPVGLLGAILKRCEKTGYYKIKKLYKGENWNPGLKSPLTEVGVNAQEGDYLIAVNGVPTNTMNNPFKALLNTVGKQVSLKINSKPEEKGSREVVVIPIRDEGPLAYYTWVHENIEKVNKATKGKVGYIHVPDMGVRGLNEFVKLFYPQLRKKALIIDVRGNGGGNVSPMLIERLRREIAMIDMSRNTVPGPDPGQMLLGPKVCLLDEFSASDGDLFPYRFKKYKMGKLIGKRSWGGVVGIRGTLPFIDGGNMTKPEFAPYSTDGKNWIIEGHGVEPDIFVENDPAKEYAGIDEQLNKAIEVILEELKTKEKTLPPIPPYPIKKK
jgi:tricorn protease